MSKSESKLAYLQTVDIFQDLSPDEMNDVEKAVPMFTCEPGRVFYRAEEPAEVLFILKKGEVALTRVNENGMRLITSTLQEGTVFGEMPLVGQRMHSNQAESLTSCLICSMSRRDVLDLVARYPSIALRITEVLSSRLRTAEERLEEMAFQGVRERLASLILRLATESDWRGNPVVKGLTHQHLAEILGTYRETISTTMADFKSRGLVEVGRKRITILDPDQLQELTRT